MDRQQLARAIDVGRSSTLNCFETTKDIAGIAAEIADDDPLGPMFRNKYLNESIVFKIVDSIVIKGKRRYGVETLIYFPYNHKNIYEGGDSILMTDERRAEKLLHKCGLDPAKDNETENSVWDNDMMDMIDELPTLDPFLLKCKAQQLGIEDKLNEAYFNISLEEWNRIQKPIRQKIDALVRKALGMADGEESPDPNVRAKIDQNISKFLKKIWEARDIDGIEDFVYGMEMPPERAPELFFAWKAICYYQVQFSEIEHSMRRLFAWIGNPKTAYPADFGGMRSEAQDQIKSDIKLLRALFRENYTSIVTTLKDYEESYRMFIEDSKPGPFKEFLANADTYYVDLAACLSGNSHAINLLEDQVRRTGAQIYSDQHRTLIECMLGVFGVDSSSQDIQMTG
tara:strand:- start:70389 stop:71582 length:1194 start_codon:yes stop_codon:yes gene_type:complete